MKRFIEEKVTKAKTQGEEEADFCFWPPPACSSLCGRVASSIIKVTHQISLPICEECREKIDPTHRFEYTPFKEEKDKDKDKGEREMEEADKKE